MFVGCDNGVSSIPTVDYVAVTTADNATSVEKGKTLQFNASVTGTNNPAQTVTWSIVETGKKAGTNIIEGLLTVASDESLTALTIKATSTVDVTKTGSIQVTVNAPSVSGTSGDFEYNGTMEGVTITKYTGTSTSIEIPSKLDGYTVIGIGYQAFMSKNLTSVIIGNDVTNIGDGAFSENQLNSITIGENVILGYRPFWYTRGNFMTGYSYVNNGFVEAYESTGRKAGTYTANQNIYFDAGGHPWSLNGTEIILTKLLAPPSVTATGTNGFNVNVSWSSVLSATSYDVYYRLGNTSAEMKFAGNFTGNSCTVKVGTNMYVFFYVRAKNSKTTSEFTAAPRTQATS